MVETDCTEVRLAEKSKASAGEKVRERQIGIGGRKGAGGNYKIKTYWSNARRSER